MMKNTGVRAALYRVAAAMTVLVLMLTATTRLGRADDLADEAELQFQRGNDSYEAKDYKGALASFKKVLTVAPTDANTNYLAGLATAGGGDDKKAAGFFQKAVKFNDSLIPAHRALALTRARLGDAPGATAERDALQKKLDACGADCATAADLKSAIADIEAAIAAPPPATPAARLELKLPDAFASAPRGDLAYLDAVALINEHRYAQALASLGVKLEGGRP